MSSGSATPEKEHRRPDAGHKRSRYSTSDRGSPAKGSASPRAEELPDRRRDKGRPLEPRSAADPETHDVKTLYVTKLSRKTREKDLEEAFGKFGELGTVKVIKDQMTQESRGYGFVEFKEAEAAQKAIAALDGSELMEARIIVELSRRRRPRPRTPNEYLGKRPYPDYPYDRHRHERRPALPEDEEPDRRRRESNNRNRDYDRPYSRSGADRRPAQDGDARPRRYDDSRSRERGPPRRPDDGDYGREERPRSYHDQPRPTPRPKYKPSRSPSPRSSPTSK